MRYGLWHNGRMLRIFRLPGDLHGMLWDLLPIMKYLSLFILFAMKLESFSLNTFEERQGKIFTQPTGIALLIPYI